MTEEKSAIDLAMDAINGPDVDPWETQETQQQETQQQETQETQQQETKTEETVSKSEYYARLIDKDREIRELKSKLKGNSNSLEDLAKTDPMAVLQKLGIGIDQILEHWVGNTEEQKPEPQTNDELAQLKEELEKFKKAQESSQYEAQYRAEVQKITEVAAGDKDRWELVNGLKDQGSIDLVIQTASEFYKANDELPDLTEVLDSVENYYEEQNKNAIDRLKSFNKLRTLFEIQQEEREQAAKEEIIQPPKPEIKKPQQTTISASMTSESQLSGTPTEEERIKRAIALLDQWGD